LRRGMFTFWVVMPIVIIGGLGAYGWFHDMLCTCAYDACGEEMQSCL
jgi:hypothetical protein